MRRKIWFFSVISISSFAIPKDSCVQEVCCEESTSVFSFSYPYVLDLNCPQGFNFYVDGLAFQAKQDGMQFAIEDTSGDGQTPTSPITYGKVIGFSGSNSDWDYNPGFRIGFGFFLDYDQWNLDANWTRVNITNYKHATASTSGGLLIPLWVLGDGTPNGGILYDPDGDCNLYVVANLFGPRASAVWKAHYDMFDFCLEKASYASRYLVVKPHFGVRFGAIDQHFSVDYGGGYHSADTTEDCPNCATQTCPPMGSGRTIHHGDNNFRGIGLRGGISSDWILGKGWAIFQDVSASVLSGKFSIHQNMILPSGITCPGFTSCAEDQSCASFANVVSLIDGFDFDYDFYRAVPNLELSIGLSWDHYFDRNKYHLSFKAAYEFIMWWNMLHMRKFFSATSLSSINPQEPCTLNTVFGGSANDTTSRGNFSMNGFSLRFQLDI